MRTTLITTLGMVAAWCACAPPNHRAEPGVLVVSEAEQTAAFARNFNPLLEIGNQRWPARRAMYEPMLIFDVNAGVYQAWLATGYTWQDDARELRFRLRRGVRWSDGAPFTAADVVFTFELLREHPALDGRGVWGRLEGVRADDDHTVVVRFRDVHVPALEDIAHQAIVPAHVWRHIEEPQRFRNPEPVATGPFTEIVQFEPHVYQVGRNEHYWGGTPAVRALKFLAFPGNEQSNIALIRGEVDWAGSFVPAIDRIFVDRDPAHHHYWFPPLDGTVMLFANTSRAPYEHATLRKALSMAIDRETLVDVAMHGYARPADATGLSERYARYHSAEAAARGTWTRYDPAAAASALDTAGIRAGRGAYRRLPDGSPWRVRIIVPAGWSDWVRAANLIARNLRDVGIDASFRTLDFNAWYDKLSRGDYELSLGWTEPTSSPYGHFRNLMSATTLRPQGAAAAANWHRFADPKADELLSALARATTLDDEEPLVRDLQELFVDHAPAIPLFPSPVWAEFNTRRFTGFPNRDAPYATPSPNAIPQALRVLTRLVPR